MKLDNRELILYLLADSKSIKEDSLEVVVEKAIKNGVSFVHLREEDISLEELKSLALKLKEVTDKYGIPFVMSDNIELASEVDTDGVHISNVEIDIKEVRELVGLEKIIGVSANTIKEAKKAEENGADYITVGPIFTTELKDDSEAISPEFLKSINDSVHIPVVAIGGINQSNIESLKDTGIDGTAVRSAILSKDDIAKAARELRKLADKSLAGK